MNRGGRPQTSFVFAATALAFTWMAVCPSHAQAQAVLSSNPTNVDFGDKRISVESEPVTTTIANIGDTTATDISCRVANRPPFNDPEDLLAFSISGCPTTLPSGATFEIDISLTPHSVGPIGALMEITYENGAASDTLSFYLDGTGIDGPDLVVNGDWSDIDNGEQHVLAGATAPATQVPMENQHPDLALSITAFNLIGANCSQFAFGLPSMPLFIPAATTYFFSVTFDPSDYGVKTCEVTFVSDDFDPPDTVTVMGTGTNQTIEVTPYGYDFGAIDVSAGAVTQDFHIANDGDLGDLTILSVSLYGATCSAFSLSGVPATPFDVSPGDIEIFTMAFDPLVLGGYECTVEILSNDDETPTMDIPLTGTGIESDPIFADGFESGTTDRWSAVVP